MPSWLNSELDINAVKSSVKKTMSPFLATEKGATSVASKHFGLMKKKSRGAPQSSEVPVSVASKHFNNPFKKQPSVKNSNVVEEAPPLDKAPKESRTESPAVEDSSSTATERMASPVMVEEVKSDDAASVQVDNIANVVKDNTKDNDSGRDSRASVRSVSKEENSSMSSGDEIPPKDQPVEVREETRKEDERKEEEEEALDEETVMTMAKTAPTLVVATTAAALATTKADDQEEYVTEESFDSFEEASIEAVQHDGRVALGFFVHPTETEETETMVDMGVVAQTVHFAETMMEKHLACLNPCVDKVGEWHTNVMPKVQVWQTVVMSKCAEKAEEWQTTVMPQCVETVDQLQTSAKMSMSKLMTRPTVQSSPEEVVEDRNDDTDTMEASDASELRA